jgi:hypothetical protein
MKMKRFAQAVLILAIVLVTVSVSWGQDHFQTGDVFAGIGNGQIRWYRGGLVLHTLSVGTNTFDTGMAFDTASNLLATDFSLGKVTKFDVHGTPSLFAGDFGAVSPESLVFDSTGNLFVGDAYSATGSGLATIWKLDSTGHFLTSYTVTTENRGADWIDLAADQKTIFYTSEGRTIKRFDTSTNTQLSDFVGNEPGLPGAGAFALKILPSGNVLVADTSAVLQLNTLGAIIHTYSPCGESGCGRLFSLTLDPDGRHFWVGDSSTGKIYEIRIADAGAIVDQTIVTGVVPTGTDTSGLNGVIVFGEINSSNTVNLQFPSSPTPQTLIATIAPNGNKADPAAQSLALTVASVDPPINVSVTFFYEPTDVSTLTRGGEGIADGICENGATEATDFDCRLAADFTYPSGSYLSAGDKLVPHCIPSHNNLCVWVRVIATKLDGSPAVEGTDYTGPIEWYYAWNTNPSLVSLLTNYGPGWNSLNPQMYDRPGGNTPIDFITNISTITKFSCDPNKCVGTADPGKGGGTKTLNDIVVAAPPNPPSGVPDVVQLIVPQNGRSPFPYLKQLPMLVSFTLENESQEKSDRTALTSPHTVSIGTLELDSNGNPIPVQYPAGFPTTFTYNPFFKAYYIFLSPAPYTVGQVYTLQIDSDLFPQPVNVKFVVKNFQF